MTPAAAATKVPTRHITKPPALSSSNGGPSMARMVGLAASAAVVSRPTSVSGTSSAYRDTVAGMVTHSARIHTNQNHRLRRTRQTAT